jgi:L-malate glycosyltransferase
MNVLIYAPVSGNRSPDQQAQAELLISMGHTVTLLTWSAESVLHDNFRKLGASAFSSAHKKGRSVIFFLKQAIYLISFCKKHKIDIIFSHLQGNAFVAGIARPFLKARLFYIRHNADYFALKGSRKDIYINKWANRLSPSIMAISNNVKEELIKEGVKPGKIIRINLCYNFNNYLPAEITGKADSIRKESGGELVVLCIARLDDLKRHLLAFDAIKQVNDKGYNCSLICIGEGEKRIELESWIRNNNMTDKISLHGLVTNVADYILASDLQLLLSCSEASNQAIKESAFFKRTAIVCNKVGDFESYIVNKTNGFIVDKENPVPQTVADLQYLYNNREKLEIFGEQLQRAVVTCFGLENVKQQYQQLLQ